MRPNLTKLTIAELCDYHIAQVNNLVDLQKNGTERPGLYKLIEETTEASAAEIRRRDDEVAALRTELAAAMNEIASHNMTIKTLSEHIANSIDDGEEWLDSYIGTGEISE